MLKIMTLKDCPAVPMDNGRGETVHLVDGKLTDVLDLHLNRLRPDGAAGFRHRHSKSCNIYIVKIGQGRLEADGNVYTIGTDQIVFIPAGMPHSLSNVSDEPFELFEIYAPAGKYYDFTLD